MEHKFSSVMSVEKFRLRRFASINDVPIQESERLFRWKRTWSPHKKGRCLFAGWLNFSQLTIKHNCQ